MFKIDVSTLSTLCSVIVLYREIKMTNIANIDCFGIEPTPPIFEF